MSLAATVHAYREYIENTPVEHMQKIPLQEAKMLPDIKWIQHIPTAGGIYEEDMRWLTK